MDNSDQTSKLKSNDMLNSNKKRDIPLYSLVKNKRKLILLPSAVIYPNIQNFVNRNRKLLIQGELDFFISSFTYNVLNEDTKKIINFLLNKNSLKIINNISNIASLFKHFSPQGYKKDEVCVVSNEPDEIKDITANAKRESIFVQIFNLSSTGELFKPQNEFKQQSYRSSQDNNANKPQYKSEHKDECFLIRTIPETMKILPIKTSTIDEGTLVIDASNNPVRLKKAVMVHPNAITYSTDRNGICAKIFNRDILNTFIEEKVKRMLTRKIKYKGLCWPIEIVRDKEGNFVGYLVEEAKGVPLHLSIFKRAKMQQLFPTWTKKDLCDLTITILSTIQFLHRHNILLGCINPAAIMIVDKETVYFLDTDNYQIEGFPSLIHNVTFTPPELLDRKIYLCTKSNDNYGIALLLFMLLMPGKLPYTLGNGNCIEKKILNSHFSFSFKDEHGSHAMPSVWRFMWSHLTPFKPLFYATFRKGEKYSFPENRRNIDEWLGTLRYFRNELNSPYDPESLKLYPTTFKRRENIVYYKCSCCGASHPDFYFFNPKDKDKICNGCIDKMSNVSFVCQCCGKTYYYTNRTALFHRMKKESDADWRDQKYCRDCKSKTIKCKDCGQDKPYFMLKNGRCLSCNDKYRKTTFSEHTCKVCGRSFVITIGEHEYFEKKHLSIPTRCPECRKK